MENPTFHLEGIVKTRDEMQDFSGPLNLILMLLSKNKIEIRDLRISDILDQYIEYINQMQEMDLDIASEFVQMASHLVFIKTRTLLASDEDEITELEELMSSLEQLKCHDAYMSVKAVTPELLRMSELGLMMFSKPAEPLKPMGSGEYRYCHEPHELIEALASIFTRGSGGLPQRSEILVPRRIVYGVREKSEQLISLFKSAGSKTLKELYRMSHSRSEVIATFISVLELCSMGNLEIRENDGELTVFLINDAPIELTETVSE